MLELVIVQVFFMRKLCLQNFGVRFVGYTWEDLNVVFVNYFYFQLCDCWVWVEGENGFFGVYILGEVNNYNE